jgi:UDP-N-acetylmuramate--alanine ligase
MFFRPQPVHFTGIGGIGMSGLAEVLLNLGYPVSGSDLRSSPITSRLRALGARIFEGHDAAHLGDARALVVSSAVDPANPELAEARRRGIPVIPRGELLAELMRLKFGVAVAGSHGKTTTTSMAATILSELGLDPTVVVGGRVSTMGGANARVGRSDFLVVESDESDGSFLRLAPIIAVVTNIDHEHLDHYHDFASLRQAFLEFINKVPFYGVAILCLDDPHLLSLLPEVRRRTLTYGRSAQADLIIQHVTPQPFGSRFTVRGRQGDLGEFTLQVPGAHNVLNATAAIAVALELEQEPDAVRRALAAYRGVDRRFTVRGEAAGVTVIDDYGHHPTEIRATLATARACGFDRVLVLFQPHRYSRTELLMDEFARAFHDADVVLVTEIYAASEAPRTGVTGAALAERMRAFGHRAVEFVDTLAEGVRRAAGEARAGDVVVTLGAGSVSQAADLILAALAGGAREVNAHG